MVEKDERDTAFLKSSLPCNPIPFINRLKELSETLSTDEFISDPRVRSNVNVLNSIIHGPMFMIDSLEEYRILEKQLNQ